jgi:polysaccharide export outer membrane protein
MLWLRSARCCYDPRSIPRLYDYGGSMIQQLRLCGGSAAARARGLAAGLTAALLLAACTTPSFPPAPSDASSVDYNYHVGPSDVVNVIVWRNPELSMSVPVRPDGRITTPLIDDLEALGKTPTELARDIEKALVKYIRDPVVTVIVTNFVGPASEQVRVIGEAAKPQTLACRRDMTVLDVMIAAGGLTDFADGNAARIFRVAEGGKLYSVRLRDLIKRGDITANVAIRPGDILIIPQSWF